MAQHLYVYLCKPSRCINSSYQQADKAKDIEPGSEYVLTIFVYKATHQKPYQKTWERLKCAQEFQALGSSLLIDVIEKIHCVTNDGLFLEVENTDIDLTALINAKVFVQAFKCA